MTVSARGPAAAPPSARPRAQRPAYFGGNAIQVLRGGDALFPAMRIAIDAARTEIWLATYIFHDDPAALALADALVDAARRGVRVHVVIDGFGSKASLPVVRPRLEAAGVEVAVFRPMDTWWRWLQPGQLRRLHQKLCVVDGEVAFVGGINLLDDRLDLNHGAIEAPRLDFAVLVRGPLVEPVAQTSRAVWNRARLGHAWREELSAVARDSQPMQRVQGIVRGLRRAHGPAVVDDDVELPPLRAALAVRDNLRQRRTIERSYIEAIAGARSRAWIVSPYFYPGRAFRRSLRNAAARGVDVRLLMQGRWDYRTAAVAARALYAELLGRGIRIYEYTPAFLHAKVAVIDDTWATVGSSNIDPLSLLLNLEANVIVRDAGFAAELSSQFDEAVAASRSIDARQALGGGLLGAARRALVAWCAYVYLRLAGVTGRY